MQLGPRLLFRSGQGRAAFVRCGQVRSPLGRVFAGPAERLVRLSDRLQCLGDVGFARGIGQGRRDLVQLQLGSLGGPARHCGGGNGFSVGSPGSAEFRLGGRECCSGFVQVGGNRVMRERGDGLEAHWAVIADVQVPGEGDGGMCSLGAGQSIPDSLHGSVRLLAVVLLACSLRFAGR